MSCILRMHRPWVASHQEMTGDLGWRRPVSNASFCFVIEGPLLFESITPVSPERGGEIVPHIVEKRRFDPTPAKRFPAKIGSVNAITAASLEAILGAKGHASQGMFKMVIGRPAKMHGASVGAAMGVNTRASFARDDEEGVLEGNFVVTANELQPVLRARGKCQYRRYSPANEP